MNVDETLKRLQGHRGVEGVVIATHAGAAIRSSFADEETTRRYAAAMSRLAGSASEAVQSVDEAVRTRFSYSPSSCSFVFGVLLTCILSTSFFPILSGLERRQVLESANEHERSHDFTG